ncbi:hypothetical protein Tco_0045012 [Tanacetum coccineum]
MPNPKPSIPYPSRRNDERQRENVNEQKEKFYEIFKDMSFEISFMDALTLMPKFASTLKALIRNKEKLKEADAYLAPKPMIQLYRKLMNPIMNTGDGEFLFSKHSLTVHLSPPPNQGNLFARNQKNIKLCEAKTTKSSIDEPPEKRTMTKKAVQHQRRVNPKIHDVIKKEVEKLLDAGLIYPISDSPWVSPVHCVPKKGGMTIVTNDENEL